MTGIRKLAVPETRPVKNVFRKKHGMRVADTKAMTQRGRFEAGTSLSKCVPGLFERRVKKLNPL